MRKHGLLKNQDAIYHFIMVFSVKKLNAEAIKPDSILFFCKKTQLPGLRTIV